MSSACLLCGKKISNLPVIAEDVYGEELNSDKISIVPFGDLIVNLAQSISDTPWHWAARQTAGGGTCLQITGGLQPTAIIVLHE